MKKLITSALIVSMLSAQEAVAQDANSDRLERKAIEFSQAQKVDAVLAQNSKTSRELLQRRYASTQESVKKLILSRYEASAIKYVDAIKKAIKGDEAPVLTQAVLNKIKSDYQAMNEWQKYAFLSVLTRESEAFATGTKIAIGGIVVTFIAWAVLNNLSNKYKYYQPTYPIADKLFNGMVAAFSVGFASAITATVIQSDRNEINAQLKIVVTELNVEKDTILRKIAQEQFINNY